MLIKVWIDCLPFWIGGSERDRIGNWSFLERQKKKDFDLSWFCRSLKTYDFVDCVSMTESFEDDDNEDDDDECSSTNGCSDELLIG